MIYLYLACTWVLWFSDCFAVVWVYFGLITLVFVLVTLGVVLLSFGFCFVVCLGRLCLLCFALWFGVYLVFVF